MGAALFIEQLLLGDLDNFTYIVGDKDAGDAVVIDPSGPWDEVQVVLKKNAFSLKGVCLTHGHYDHVVGVERLDVPVYLSDKEAPCYTPPMKQCVRIGHGGKIMIGRFEIECLHTPGHTPGCQCFLVAGNLFTGDTLFMDAIGRTDFPGGDPRAMFESLQLIKRLPDTTEVWPGHHYGRLPHGALSHLKRHNSFLACEDRAEFMNYS